VEGMVRAAAGDLRAIAPADELALADLYLEQTGPSLGFLMTLMGQGRCQGWTLGPAGRSVAVIWLSLIDAEAELLDIRVHKSTRNRGLGRQLLSLGLRKVAGMGARTCHLEVRRSNVVAQRLYQHCGFVESGCRRDYYRSEQTREDAILMSLDMEAAVADEYSGD
jgi:ribosomal-protein-alanine N-acetyltransferase